MKNKLLKAIDLVCVCACVPANVYVYERDSMWLSVKNRESFIFTSPSNIKNGIVVNGFVSSSKSN